MATSPLPPPGWFDDAEHPGGVRFWDGGAWTEDRLARAASRDGEPVAFTMAHASWWSRVGASLIDHCVCVLIGALAALVIYLSSPDAVAFTEIDDDGTRTTYEWWLIGGAIAVVAAELLYRWLWMGVDHGHTIGKRAMGLRIVALDGTPIGMWRGLYRELLIKNVTGLIGFGPIVDHCWPLWDRRQRALHDLVCDTRVVRTRAGAADELLPALGAPGTPGGPRFDAAAGT